MKLALVFNPFSYKVHEENLKIVMKYFGLFPPLSLAWVAAIAERAGHEVIIIDARTLGLTKEETLKKIRDFDADILGFMMTTYMYPDTLQWIKYLKQHTGLPVLIGGYHLRVYPEVSLAHPEIDYGVKEHALYTVPMLLDTLGKGPGDLSCIPGLIFRRGDTVVVNPDKDIDFNDFPFPARHLLPNELYAEFPTEERLFTVMVTSLGCPWQCSFCEAGSTPYCPRNPETVVAEMEECYKKYSIREIDIFDYNFTTDEGRVKEICRGIIEKGLKIKWACRSRVNISRETLALMRDAGCGRIYFGIESGSPEILKRINKGISLDMIEKTLDISDELGIRNLGYFLVGAPGDTEETVRQTIAFSKKLPLDYAQFSKCLAKPLTPLWKEMKEQEGEDYWEKWIKGEASDRELPRPWTELTNARIDELTKKAYIEFYYRPKFILSALARLKSFKELKRKAASAFDMMFHQEKASIADPHFAAFNENHRKELDKIRKDFLGD